MGAVAFPSVLPLDASSKKLSHNANERERRKKLNALYENLSSLLPQSITRRKLSNPAIVCRVLKYIPHLRREVSFLIKQRDELLALKRISEVKQRALDEGDFDALAPNVDVFVSDTDLFVTIQISENTKLILSSLLLLLQEERLEVLNASTYAENARVWHELQLKAMEGTYIDASVLRLKILLLCEQSRGKLFSPQVPLFK